MPIDIELTGDLDLDQIERALEAVEAAIGDAAVSQVSGAGTQWPIRTGASLHGFGWRPLPAALGIQLTNRQFYARFHRDAAVQTLQARLPAIVSAVDQALQREIDADPS